MQCSTSIPLLYASLLIVMSAGYGVINLDERNAKFGDTATKGDSEQIKLRGGNSNEQICYAPARRYFYMSRLFH